jgi:hypothetical protein
MYRTAEQVYNIQLRMLLTRLYIILIKKEHFTLSANIMKIATKGILLPSTTKNKHNNKKINIISKKLTY